MPSSTSRLSYQDCYDLFDKALADPKGTRARVKDSNAATYLRSRLHYARKVDRVDNRLVYEEGDPLFGRSTYDPILISVRHEHSKWYVYLIRVDAIHYETESLNGLDESPPRDNEPVEIQETRPVTEREFKREVRRA